MKAKRKRQTEREADEALDVKKRKNALIVDQCNASAAEVACLLSSHGKVPSTQYRRQAREQQLRHVVAATGPAKVLLTHGRSVEHLVVARLVVLHFLPPPYYKQLIPRDGNPRNLRADNLLWLVAGVPLDLTANYRGRAGQGHYQS